MYKSKHIIEKHNGKIRRFAFFSAVLMLLFSVFSLFNYHPPHVSADTSSTDDRKLQNGSFEDGPSFSGNYSQPDQSAVPSWNTTAFQSKIELFKENTGTYIPGVTLKPTDGTYAAELNADEESTLYQNVTTSPLSVYEWGLDHGGRNGTDTMALIIGPKQSVNPSKPSKAGRDQLMQMVDWLIDQGKTSFKTSAGLGEQLTVYSKKFATSGTFEDNAGNNAFSLTPSTIYTEKWQIWIMASSKVTSGTNPWNSYGSNAEGSSESENEIDLSKYYLYTVPSGQTETLFAFVSVGVDKPAITGDKIKTYGNFLDNINFQIYHPLSGSTTTHGSAVISGSDGTTGGTGSSSGHKVTVDDKLTTYVTDGEPLKIQAIIKESDFIEGCEFVGVYYTKQDDKGNPVTAFLQLSGNEIDYSENLTDEEKAGKWIKSTNDNGDIVYTYYMENVTSATDLHFVFLKSPTVTYDPNGGKPYEVDRTYNTDEALNVYSFKPVTSDSAQAGTGTLFIEPYVSKEAEGQNDGWKFMGWLLTGDIVDNVEENNQVSADQLGKLILPAEHTIACDYNLNGVNGDMKAQYFKIYNDNVSLTKLIIPDDEQNKDVGVTWTDNGETISYANVHKGITMVAQWRWRQAFIPQTHNINSNSYENSNTGGTVAITSVTNESDENYNATYENVGKSYHATTGELVIVTATANAGYIFEGWYDASGKLVSTNAEYSYIETKESVNTFYARFSNSVTQTYIRQIKKDGSWEDTTDDKVGTLGRYTYTDAVGMLVSSTATTGSGYKFVGWYDSDGNEVASDMLINNGATISYKTTGNATYYARFEKTVTQTFIRLVKNGDNWVETTDDTIGTLTRYTHTDVVGKSVSSKATAGQYYEFVGWYDSKSNDANEVADNMLTNNGATISYTTTGNATYYARFKAKEFTQTFIRQVKNGDNWVETTDDTIGTLDCYSNTDVAGTVVKSTATAGSGYKFVGWYDSNYNKVADDMLKENDDNTISYTTTGDATYYARFEATVTETYIRQVKNGDNWVETTDDTIGTLDCYSNTDVTGTVVKSTATAGSGYRFVGWYNEDGSKVADNMLTDGGMTITHTITDGATYYARFEKACTLNVSKIDGDKSTEGNKIPLADAEFTLYKADDSGDTTITYNDKEITCTSVGVNVTVLNAEGTKAIAFFENVICPNEVYYLVETKAPTGYRLLNEPVKITLGDSDNFLVDRISKDITNNEVNIELANYLTLEMPTSGISFTGGWFVVIGFSLLTVATIGLFWIKISRYKQK